jgi:hypothetical protein
MSLELHSPFEARSITMPQRTVLIWGGVGRRPIRRPVRKVGWAPRPDNGGRASSKNFDLVKGLGADEVFDYRDDGVVEKIRAATDACALHCHR